jgi:hypothetical protein
MANGRRSYLSTTVLMRELPKELEAIVTARLMLVDQLPELTCTDGDPT